MARAAAPRPGRKRRPAAPSDDAIRDFLRGQGMAWLALPNIVGVSVGTPLRGGRAGSEIAVIFDVIAKLPSPAEIVRSGGRPIPATVTIDGVALPTDVVQRWPEAHDLPSDPVCGGISIGCAVETGTLGAIYPALLAPQLFPSPAERMAKLWKEDPGRQPVPAKVQLGLGASPLRGGAFGSLQLRF